jgi:hypothetical protein
MPFANAGGPEKVSSKKFMTITTAISRCLILHFAPRGLMDPQCPWSDLSCRLFPADLSIS